MKSSTQAWTVAVLALSALTVAAYQTYSLEQQLTAVKSINAQTEEQKLADTQLGQYAINMMYHTSASVKLSDVKKQIIARSIVKVANDVYDNLDHKKAFIAVIAIESSFKREAQSPTGPKGLSQVAKKAFQEGLEHCGIPNANADDVWDMEINLYAGACYFRALLENNNNDPYIAIVAYNQGPNSKSIKTYSKSGYLDDVEALKYVAKFNFLKRTVPDGKVPEIPAFEKGPNTDKVKPTVTGSDVDGQLDRSKSKTKTENNDAKASR